MGQNADFVLAKFFEISENFGAAKTPLFPIFFEIFEINGAPNPPPLPPARDPELIANLSRFFTFPLALIPPGSPPVIGRVETESHPWGGLA